MPESNKRISQMFEQMAFLCELDNQNPFKVRAYKKAASVISMLSEDVLDISEDKLCEIRGIGRGILKHINEIKHTQTFSEFEELKSKYPLSLYELLNIEGLGSKRAKILYEKLGIDSIDSLVKAAKKGMIRNIDGFGEKLEKMIIESVEKGISTKNRFLYSFAKKTANDIIKYLNSCGHKKVGYAGSLRRCAETVGDIDIIAIGGGKVIDDFLKFSGIERVLSAGELKSSVILKNQMQCDLRVFEESSYGAALCYFTGSKQHNIRLRELANKAGYLLNEYGLFKKSVSKEMVAGKTEEEIYKKLGMQYIPPELREDNGEIELALKNAIPELVSYSDINGDAHSHTFFTDGANSIEEIVDHLSKRYKWFFIGDHSIPLNFVNGLDFKRYTETRKELLNLSERYSGVNFDRSLETEILKDGSLPFKPEELDKISMVISAVHSNNRMKRDDMTARILKAISNPYSDIIAHLTGRLIFERDEMDADYDLIFETASKNNTVFEINGQPDRLDLKDINVRKVKSLGLKVILSSDAHSIEQFDNIEYALNNARRAGLTKNDIINSLGWKELNEFIKENRTRKKQLQKG
jgi:DNA polymerase (family 10)